MATQDPCAELSGAELIHCRLINGYGNAVKAAYDAGYLTSAECSGLKAVFGGLMMLRTPGGHPQAQIPGDLSGTDDPQGGAA